MRIVSKFHDYYDHIMQYGMESDDVTYVREPRKEDGYFPYYHPRNCCFNAVLIGFAGQVFPIVHMMGDTNKPSRLYKTIYDWHEYQKLQDSQTKKNRPVNSVYYRYGLSNYDINDDINNYNQLCSGDYSKFFSEAPIWVIKNNSYRYDSKRTIEYNPCLRSYDFAKILDPYTAFQNLRMWLSAQAHPEPPIPHIDDKTMAEAKGFNKWSFRKEPTKCKK